MRLAARLAACLQSSSSRERRFRLRGLSAWWPTCPPEAFVCTEVGCTGAGGGLAGTSADRMRGAGSSGGSACAGSEKEGGVSLGDANESRHVPTDDDVVGSCLWVAATNVKPLSSPTETAATPQITRRSILAPPLDGAPLVGTCTSLAVICCSHGNNAGTEISQ